VFSALVLIFIVYFLAHALIRTALGPTLTPEEFVILHDAQKFAWTYNGEMPLYAWSQGAVINAFGPNILSLTLMKNMTMLMICLSVFTLVQRVANTSSALAATISLLFVPHLVWTSQHSLSTPVLATLFAATTVLSFSRLTRMKSVPRYGVLGAMIGLGAITSHTFLLVPAALILAAITSPFYRNVIFDRGFIATLMVGGFIVFWPYYELFKTGELMMPTLSGISSFGWEQMFDRARGFNATLQTVLAFSSLLIVGTAVVVFVGLGGNQTVNEATVVLRRLLLRTVAFGMILIFGIAVLVGGSWMDQADLQPLLFLVIILLVTPAHYSSGDRWTPVQQASYVPADVD